MKQRDTVTRAMRLLNLSLQLCMVNAGSEDLSHYAESKLLDLLEETCKFASIDQNTLPTLIPVPDNYEAIDNNLKKASSTTMNEDVRRRKKKKEGERTMN